MPRLSMPSLPGQTKIINHTCYRQGYSILSLDNSVADEKHKYTTISGVVSSLDESIIDRILTKRSCPFTLWTSRRAKLMRITNLIIQDLGIDPSGKTGTLPEPRRRIPTHLTVSLIP